MTLTFIDGSVIGGCAGIVLGAYWMYWLEIQEEKETRIRNLEDAIESSLNSTSTNVRRKSK